MSEIVRDSKEYKNILLVDICKPYGVSMVDGTMVYLNRIPYWLCPLLPIYIVNIIGALQFFYFCRGCYSQSITRMLYSRKSSAV